MELAEGDVKAEMRINGKTVQRRERRLSAAADRMVWTRWKVVDRCCDFCETNPHCTVAAAAFDLKVALWSVKVFFHLEMITAPVAAECAWFTLVKEERVGKLVSMGSTDSYGGNTQCE